MNKQLVILGIVVLLSTIGLSGCDEIDYLTQSNKKSYIAG